MKTSPKQDEEEEKEFQKAIDKYKAKKEKQAYWGEKVEVDLGLELLIAQSGE